MTTITTQRGLSLTRITIALLTLGISIPFIGIRRTRKTTIRD